jgi:hypothetical protein
MSHQELIESINDLLLQQQNKISVDLFSFALSEAQLKYDNWAQGSTVQLRRLLWRYLLHIRDWQGVMGGFSITRLDNN